MKLAFQCSSGQWNITPARFRATAWFRNIPSVSLWSSIRNALGKEASFSTQVHQDRLRRKHMVGVIRGWRDGEERRKGGWESSWWTKHTWGPINIFLLKKSCQNIFELFSTCQQFFYSSKQQQSQHAVSGTVNRIQSALHRTWLKYRTILNNSVHLKPIQAAIGRQESTQNWKLSTQNIGRGLKTHLTLYNYTSVSLKLFLARTDWHSNSFCCYENKRKKNAADFQEESGCREARKSLFKRFTASI